MNTLSFPGLGIGEFRINRTAFSVFGFDIRWYGIIITTGIVLAFLYVLYRSKFEKIKVDDVLDLGLFSVLPGIVGARLYYVFSTWDKHVVTGGYFFENVRDTFVNIVSTRNGGLAVYGGIIAVVIAAALVAKYKKIKFAKFLDMLGPAAMIGQMVGRWGNFFNVEAFGTATDLPWRMGILTTSGTTRFVHPTFLYESLWNLLGFLIINALYKKKKYDGQIFVMYVTWYGLGRMFIEGLRTDSLMLGVFRISQIVAFVSFAAGTIVLIVLGIKARNERIAASAYTNLFIKKDGDEVSSINEETKPDITVDIFEAVAQESEKADDIGEDAETEEVAEDGKDN